MCLIYEGQLTGARTQLPVHLGRWPVEPVNTEIALLYERLLAPLPRTAVGRGNARLLRPLPVSPEDDTAECIVVVQWQGDGEEFDLAVMNFAPASARCHLMLTGIGLAGKRLSIADWLGDPSRSEWLDQDASGRSFLELPPHAARLLHCRPVLEGKS